MNYRINKKLLLLVCLSMLLLILSCLLAGVIKNSYFFCSGLIIILFLLLDNPFAWKNESLLKEKHTVIDVVCLAFICVYFLLRITVPFYFIYRENFTFSYLIVFEIAVVTFVEALGEEILFKAGVYRLLLGLKLNRFVTMLIVSIVFALGHFISSPFVILEFVVIFLIQMMLLFLFNRFPSIWLLSFIHFALNFGNKLLAEGLVNA